MVFRPEPVFQAVEHIKSKIKDKKAKVVLLSPQGKTLNQNLAKEFSKRKHLVLICGHYEGVDDRVKKIITD